MNEYQWDQQRRHDRERRELLARDLHDKYMTAGMPKEVSDRLFESAWEHGRSAGTHEVETFYADARDIVNAAFRAGRNATRSAQTSTHITRTEWGFTCEELSENGSCIHSDHMQAAGL